MTSSTRVLQAPEGDSPDLELIVHALASHYAVATGASQRIRRRRLDTFDQRLRAAGLTLEHQIADSSGRLVLGRLDGSQSVTVPVQDLRWPALAGALPPGPVRDTIAPVTGIRALMVASDEKRRIQQLALQNEDEKTVARVELDAPASPRSPSPVEVIVRPLSGYDDSARRAAHLLTGVGLVPIERVRHSAAHRRKPQGRPDDPATVLMTTVLRGFLATMRENLPGLLDDVDTEFLHDFRVAVRRTRSVLKLGRPALPEVMRSRWEPDFRWLGDLTTPVRDLDVYQLDLPRMEGWLVSADPADLGALATHLRSRRTLERAALVRSLRSARFRRLVAEWDAELARLGEGPGQESLSAGQLGSRSISAAHRRVSRCGAAIRADSPAGDLHTLRKRCKELRYALEVFGPVIDAAAGKRVIADLKSLQDVLGRFQDSEVQRQALRGFAQEMMGDGTPAAAVLAMGELIGHLDVEQDQARREFDVTFARLQRPSGLELMHRLGGVT